MGQFSHYPLQKAIYQALTDNTTLMSAITGVFDRPPQGTLFPYITIGESVIEDWSTKTTTGTDQHITLHVWSREGGRKEAAQVMDQLHGLLHQAALSVEEHSMILMRFVASNLVLENDGWTYQGIMHFRTLLQAD